MSLIAADLERALDPTRLFRDATGCSPDPWQSDFLRSPSRRLALCCSRQSGKTTAASIRALSVALYRPDSLILLVSPSLRQSQEFFRTTAVHLRALGESAPEPSQESALRLTLPNGSRVVSLPGSETTTRGYGAPAMVVIDEAAFCDDALFRAVLPALAASPDGQLILLSSPAGRRGFFFECFENDDSFEKFKIDWTMCPRISAEMVELFRRVRGDLECRSEFCCEFIDDNAATVFPSELVERMFSAEVAPLWL